MAKKFDIKRPAALLSAAVITMTAFTGCGKNSTWGADIDGAQIPAGIFIYYLQSAYYDAQSKLNESTPEAADGEAAETEAPKLFSSQIEGVDAKTWIYNEATRQMQEYAAVEAKFDEYGLSLTDEEKASADSYVKQMWDYGGEYFTSLGISEKSYKSLYLNNQKRSKLFTAIYSEGGDKAVSDGEMQSYLEENYALVNYIKMELRDGEGNLLKSDGKAERMAMAEDYVKRFKDGEDFDVLRVEYENYYDALVAEAEAKAAEEAENAGEGEGALTIDGDALAIDGDDLNEGIIEVDELPAEAGDDDENEGDEGIDSENDTSDDEDSEEETAAEPEAEPANADLSPEEESSEEENTGDAPAEEADAPEADSVQSEEVPAETEISEEPDEHDHDHENELTAEPVRSAKSVIGKSESEPCQEVVDAVFGTMNKGDVQIVETQNGEYYYVVYKMDIMENDGEYLEISRSSLLFEMKDEDYDALVELWINAQSVSRNQAAYDRYDPQKMFETEG